MQSPYKDMYNIDAMANSPVCMVALWRAPIWYEAVQAKVQLLIMNNKLYMTLCMAFAKLVRVGALEHTKLKIYLILVVQMFLVWVNFLF